MHDCNVSYYGKILKPQKKLGTPIAVNPVLSSGTGDSWKGIDLCRDEIGTQFTEAKFSAEKEYPAGLRRSLLKRGQVFNRGGVHSEAAERRDPGPAAEATSKSWERGD